MKAKKATNHTFPIVIEPPRPQEIFVTVPARLEIGKNTLGMTQKAGVRSDFER